jgi:hypothetical protein
MSYGRWSLVEVASGFNSTSPIKASANNTVAAATSITVSLAAAPDFDSLSVAGFESHLNDSTAIDPRLNWTEIGEALGTVGDTGAIESQYKTALNAELDASASVSATNRDWGGIHIELRNAGS